MRLTVSPAYGRDYNSRAGAITDWTWGKDFINESQLMTGGGTYLSERDVDQVSIRYKNKTRQVLMTKDSNGRWSIG